MKKGSFVESDSYVIPNCEPKYKGIVCYKDSESDIKFDIDIANFRNLLKTAVFEKRLENTDIKKVA